LRRDGEILGKQRGFDGLLAPSPRRVMTAVPPAVANLKSRRREHDECK